MKYQTKSIKVQAMQLESNVYIGAGFTAPLKGEWLVVEDGKLHIYTDKAFQEKFERTPLFNGIKTGDLHSKPIIEKDWVCNQHAFDLLY